MKPKGIASHQRTLSRRGFLGTVAGAGAMQVVSPGWLYARADGSVPTIYYMDGYHGGPRGHMPPGCWRDIVDGLDRNPDWKLSLDVEADTWAVLRREDPETYERVKGLLMAPNARLEITGGTYAQPYGWAISGESNIRQLQRGLEVIREHFPRVRVETYAVQEPCWASCLPQILRSLGFTGASLKNASTAWGGYFAGFDAELVNWIGPDGTRLIAVPRYKVEGLLNVWETEATEVTTDYAKRCVEHGIPQPAGMCFQDLGWAAQPRVVEPWVRYATWRGYLHGIAQTKPVDWKVSMEDILTALPWGEKTLHRASRQVREAEVQMVRAEKYLAMNFLATKARWPADRLRDAWEQTMWSQAHDAWITVTTRSGRDAWAFQVASETLEASAAAQDLIENAMAGLCAAPKPSAAEMQNVQYVRVVNTTGYERVDLVEVTLSANPGTAAFEIRNADGTPLTNQAVVTRTFRELPDGEGVRSPIMDGASHPQRDEASINSATVLFRDTLPAFGWKTYKATALPRAQATDQGISITKESDGSLRVATDLYRVRFDARRGGGITSLFCLELRKEFCAQGKLLNIFRGYFATQEAWRMSSENPAELAILEGGPVRARVQVKGKIGDVPFRSVITLVQGQRRIDCQSSFHFDQDTWIGDPAEMRPEDRMKERRRSSNNGAPKLKVLFPAALDKTTLYKSSAFDVCRSRLESTNFERWDEIKHNIISTWVDLVDERQGLGFAIFSDRTTAYSSAEDEVLGLVLAWGGEAGFWWGKCPLKGDQEASYSFVPHRGRWEESGLWLENLGWEEPFSAQVMPTAPAESMSRSLLRVSPSEAILSSVTANDGELQVRVFFASEKAGSCALELGFAASSARLVELDGRVIRELPMEKLDDKRVSVRFAVSAFDICTISITPHQTRVEAL